MNITRKNSRRRGLVAVEMALILPILLLIVMAAIEGGNAFYSWLTVQKAAQLGARFATTGRGDEEGTRLAQIINVTEKGLASLDKDKAVISVRSWPDLSAAGDGIDNDPGGPCQLAEVAVLYNYEPSIPLVAELLPPSIPLLGYDRKVNEPWKPCD